MLNKELMLGKSIDVPHMWLTVGEYTDGYYGWDADLNMGAVNRLPRWYGQTLRALWSDPFAGLSTIGFTASLSVGFNLSAIVEGKMLLFKMNQFEIDTEVSGTLFDHDMLGKTIAVYFDPPLTSILPHRHSNRSRVLRRSRRSLGGSKC